MKKQEYFNQVDEVNFESNKNLNDINIDKNIVIDNDEENENKTEVVKVINENNKLKNILEGSKNNLPNEFTLEKEKKCDTFGSSTTGQEKNLDKELNDKNENYLTFNELESRSIEKDKPKKLIDELINDLGITSYTLRVLAILSLFNLADGGEFLVISLLTSKLGDIWKLTHSQKGTLGSIVFIGHFVGVWISGKVSDNYGRRPAFLLGSFLATLFALCSAFSWDFNSLLVLRALFGFGVGMLSPSANSMATEVSPTKYRSWTINLIGGFYPLGQTYAITVARNYLEGENGWRILLAAVSFPTALCCLSSFFIHESPRYFLASKQFDKAFESLDKIFSYSTIKVVFTEEMKKRIIEEESLTIEANYSSLLDKKYLKLTIQMCFTFLILSFSYYGTIYILPQLMLAENTKTMNTKDSQSKMYDGLIISAFAELPSVVLCAYIANVKLLGRIKSMSIGFAFASISASLCAFYLQHLNIFSSLYKFMLDIPYNIIYVYVLEAYPTKIRSISFGTCYMFNRIGGIITPICAQFLFAIHTSGPFLFYAFLALGGVFLTAYLPFETLDREIE